ncbi:MAG TPA: hypothetical protein DCP98_00950 [Sphaerochaeta sp.]|jgi:hypothetical protein|nr:hypothetical protein [Sphaerochaeta sp.]
MYKIACTQACLEQANRLSGLIGNSEVVLMEDIIRDPESLGNFYEMGLVFERKDKGLPETVISFINDVLGNYDLTNLDHLFSVCVCDKPYHALKMVEKLCARIGCAPSFSGIYPEESGLAAFVDQIRGGDIQLAKGSFGTTFYMKSHGLKTK